MPDRWVTRVAFDPPDRPAKTLTLSVRPELIADRNEVFAAIKNESVHLIDTLTEQSYRGDFTMYVRPGHITTAINIPVLNFLDESGRFKSMAELAALHPADRSDRYITYCGGGIAARTNVVEQSDFQSTTSR